jgi:hypothetical protein
MTVRDNPELCVPEWCDEDDEGHLPTCPNHLLDEGSTMTKGRFVEISAIAADLACDAYKTMRDEGFSHEQAKEAAVQDAEEGATCYAGIGSCGRGWCKHS